MTSLHRPRRPLYDLHPSGGELWKFPAPAGGSAYRIDGGVPPSHGPRRLALRPPPQRGRTVEFRPRWVARRRGSTTGSPPSPWAPTARSTTSTPAGANGGSSRPRWVARRRGSTTGSPPSPWAPTARSTTSTPAGANCGSSRPRWVARRRGSTTGYLLRHGPRRHNLRPAH